MTDLAATVSAAERHGGSLVEERTGFGGTEVTLRDPNGALFAVTDLRSPA